MTAFLYDDSLALGPSIFADYGGFELLLLSRSDLSDATPVTSAASDELWALIVAAVERSGKPETGDAPKPTWNAQDEDPERKRAKLLFQSHHERAQQIATDLDMHPNLTTDEYLQLGQLHALIAAAGRSR